MSIIFSVAKGIFKNLTISGVLSLGVKVITKIMPKKVISRVISKVASDKLIKISDNKEKIKKIGSLLKEAGISLENDGLLSADEIYNIILKIMDIFK